MATSCPSRTRSIVACLGLLLSSSATRGGRISLLGIFGEPVTVDLSNLFIEKGLRLYGIFGRLIYDTWERTQALLRSGSLDESLDSGNLSLTGKMRPC